MPESPPQSGQAVKPVSWPQVVLVLGVMTLLIAGVVILVAMKADGLAIISAVGIAAGALLSHFGFTVKGDLTQVKETTNGRFSEALALAQRQQQQSMEAQRRYAELALLVPPETLPPAVRERAVQALATPPTVELPQ